METKGGRLQREFEPSECRFCFLKALKVTEPGASISLTSRAGDFDGPRESRTLPVKRMKWSLHSHFLVVNEKIYLTFIPRVQKTRNAPNSPGFRFDVTPSNDACIPVAPVIPATRPAVSPPSCRKCCLHAGSLPIQAHGEMRAETRH